jgi:hypothetical protein
VVFPDSKGRDPVGKHRLWTRGKALDGRPHPQPRSHAGYGR